MTKNGKDSLRRRMYAIGQHDLICRALKMSDSPESPGSTTYEAVCVLLLKIDMAIAMLRENRSKKAKELIRYLRLHQDDEEFRLIPMYGTGLKSGDKYPQPKQ